jgi:hypothetical protein
MLAYLQLSPPLADELMQNGEVPICCGVVMPPLGDGELIVPWAWATEIPAASAAMAVKVVKVFIGGS